MKTSTVQLLSVIGLIALIVVEAPAQQRFEGTGKGQVIVQAPGPFVGTSLLDGFYVRFGPPLGQTSNEDHHLRTLEVRLQHPEPTNIKLVYADKNADDRFAYIVSVHSRTIAGVETRSTGGPWACAIQCSMPLARPSPQHVFVLRGFRLSVPSGGDRHVERLAVFEVDGVLVVAMENATFIPITANDLLFEVDYAYLPPAAVQEVGELWDTGHRDARRNIPAGASVIRGFDFRFTNGDHHVKEIGVMTPDDGRVEVFFSDKNGDDPFVWSVRWAILAPPTPPILQ
jgi:hypothetical protein